MDGPPAAGEADERLAAHLERYGALLRRTIARLSPRRLGIDFDDIEQDARLRLWRALRDAEHDLPASYVYRVAASATIDAVRRVTARREEQWRRMEEGEEPGRGTIPDPPTPPGSTPERAAERRQALDEVERALRELPEARRLAVGLHLQGWSGPQIARLLGWSEEKTRTLVARGLADLRRRLAQKGIDYAAD